MKILDIPQTGKWGISVSIPGRTGQARRALVIPSNPRTLGQSSTREIFEQVTTAWRGLTEPQREAWTAMASAYQTKAVLGQSGAMTGSQLYNKLNCTLLQFGAAMTDTPVAKPTLAPLVPTNLVITNGGGIIALKLTCPDDPGENTIVRASKGVSAGIARPPAMAILGICPVPAVGAANISSLYTAKYGVPVAGQKIFVHCNTFVDGWQSLGRTFWAIVPTAA
jgi:hypothetical protein